MCRERVHIFLRVACVPRRVRSRVLVVCVRAYEQGYAAEDFRFLTPSLHAGAGTGAPLDLSADSHKSAAADWSHASGFATLQHAMDALGWTAEEHSWVLGVLAAILFLGNIQFEGEITMHPAHWVLSKRGE